MNARSLLPVPIPAAGIRKFAAVQGQYAGALVRRSINAPQNETALSSYEATIAYRRAASLCQHYPQISRIA
jgi:hypothetical protein